MVSRGPDARPAGARATGQWFAGSDGRRWWFDSGSLALDFAYTGAMGDNPAWERLRAPEDLAAWLDGRFVGIDGTVTDRDLIDARALRGAIARVATAVSRRRGCRRRRHRRDQPVRGDPRHPAHASRRRTTGRAHPGAREPGALGDGSGGDRAVRGGLAGTHPGMLGG